MENTDNLEYDGKPATLTRWRDADTPVITVNGKEQAIRLKGVNAPEVAKPVGPDGMFIPGQLDQDPSEERTRVLQQLGGYTIVKPTGQSTYDRKVADFQDQSGHSLSDAMVNYGAVPIDGKASDKAVDDREYLGALSRLIPGFKASNPILQWSGERDMTNYRPTTDAVNEKQYAAVENALGTHAVAEEKANIERIDNILKSVPNLNPATKKRLLKERNQSYQSIFTAASYDNPYGYVMNRHDDRTIDNKALGFSGNVATTWENTKSDFMKSIGGILEMTGDATKWEWLSKRAKRYGDIEDDYQSKLPSVVGYKDIDFEHGTWNGVAKSATYLANLMVGTSLQMATQVASTWATGGLGLAPKLAWAASTIPTSLTYAGGFYTDQPDDKKNMGLALTMGAVSAALDHIGLDGMMGGEALTMVGKNEIYKAVKDKLKLSTIAEAEHWTAEATKKELVRVAEMNADMIKRQFASLEASARGIAAVSRAGLSEMGTEGLQQAAEAMAKTGQWSTDVQYDRGFWDQIKDAMIGGGVMGSSIHSGMHGIHTAQWRSALDSVGDFKGDPRAAQIFAVDNQVNPNRQYRDIADAVDREYKTQPAKVKSLQDYTSMDGTWNGIKDIITHPSVLFKQLSHSIMGGLDEKSGAIDPKTGEIRWNRAILKAITGGFGILPGDHYAGFIQRTLGKYSVEGTGMMSKDELANRADTSVTAIGNRIRDAWNQTWKQGNLLPENTGNYTVDNQNKALNQWFVSVGQMRSQMESDLKGVGLSTVDVNNLNALFEESTVHKDALAAARDKVIEVMVKNNGKRREANAAVDAILTGTPDQASYAKQYMANHGVFADPDLKGVFEDNTFIALENLKDQVARKVANAKYLGEDGSKLAALLQKAYDNKEFDSEQDFERMAKAVKDWYNIVNHDYGSLKDSPILDKVSSWLTTFTMLASLGKASLSSQTEVAMATLGTPADKIQQQLATYFDTLGAEVKGDLKLGAEKASGILRLNKLMSITRYSRRGELREKIEKLQDELQNETDPKRVEALGKEILKISNQYHAYNAWERLGFNESGFNTQSKFEYGNSNMRNAMHAFARMIGLRAQTDANRIALLSVANDIIGSKTELLRTIPKEKLFDAMIDPSETLTVDQYHALNDLQMFGMDIGFHLYTFNEQMAVLNDAINKAESNEAKDNLIKQRSDLQEHYQDMLFTVTGNMVDSVIVNPQAHNVPKYFNDPRLRWLTTMGRFMATAHAVVLPRLYRDYIRHGSTGMRYQAFAVMAGTMITAMLVNALKDELSYGDDNPYIKTKAKKLQRTVNTSGLLGQGEKLLDTITPLYPQPGSGPSASKDPFGYLKNSAENAATSLSPVAAWLAKPIRGAGELYQGQTEKGVKDIVRSMPLLGSFPIAATSAAALFKN
jgi:endonuclease YncB( thermonuclease family)